MSVVRAPAIALPDYRVTLDDVVEAVRSRYREHPRLGVVERVMRATQVATRYWCRPPAQVVGGDLPVAERLRQHREQAVALAARAGRRALENACVEPDAISHLVVASLSGHSMPGPDVSLIRELGLAPTVQRVPATQMGCAGGVWALAVAQSMVHGRPGANALVVGVDVISYMLNPVDTGMDNMIFRALTGDAAGACVVRGDGVGGGVVLGDTWEYTVPGTERLVGYHMDGAGVHARNSPELVGALGQAVRALAGWAAGTGRQPGWVVSHSGGPKILQSLAGGLGLRAGALGCAWESLRCVGNVGAASVLDAMRRQYADPPAHGAAGLVLGVGPGVTLKAVSGTWQEG